MTIKSVLKYGVVVLVLLMPMVSLGRIGVGVGMGKIHVSQELKAGEIYDLPAIPVLNTGDEPADYQFSIQFHEGQETNPQFGLKPEINWFSFSPSSFRLEPGKVQLVKVTLALPTKIQPGTYFAYLEARPIQKSVSGQTTIGIAAATQLWFIVTPTNFIQGLYYRFISLYSRYQPYDTIGLIVVLVTFALFYLFKKFQFQIVKK